MEYEVIKELKRSEKSVVQLVRQKDSEQIFIRKILSGHHEVYETLKSTPHSLLPQIYQVTLSDTNTTVIEEYIEGASPKPGELSSKTVRHIMGELCDVLEFVHKKGIIHRDIKPSNILLASDGHIRLLDFDVARMYKDEQEQDTTLLGTKGYAPPEQFGFAQTDERTDIYSLGMTFRQLLGGKTGKPGYKRIIEKCTKLDPDKRYQSIGQVKKAFSWAEKSIWVGAFVILLAALMLNVVLYQQALRENEGPPVLPAPGNPRWDGESGIGMWGNVAESGVADSEIVKYSIKLCRMDTQTPPDIEDDVWMLESEMSGNAVTEVDGVPTFETNLAMYFQENGFYYFAVAAVGDGENYVNSPFVISDAFEYTGENAPALPAPTGLAWRMVMTDESESNEWVYYATWDNLEDYADGDSFDVTVYDRDGEYVTNNIWTKENVVKRGYGGVRIRPQFLEQKDGAYRFSVQVLTSRPNEYKSSPMPDPVTEEYLSPWYYY